MILVRWRLKVEDCDIRLDSIVRTMMDVVFAIQQVHHCIQNKLCPPVLNGKICSSKADYLEEMEFGGDK